MGRPSRKEVASTVIFEETDGNVLFFVIDKQGNSKLIGSESIYPKNYFSLSLNKNYFSYGSKSSKKQEEKITMEQNKEKHKHEESLKYILKWTN